MTVTHVPIAVQTLSERLHAYGQFEEPVYSITSLNNMGVGHLEASRYEESLGCFQAALLQLEQ